jgi:hypothetical protein
MLPRGAFAHDIGASNATFLVRSTGIDVELFMGLNASALLIADNGQQIVITPNTFGDFSDRLQSAAADLFVVTSADGSALKPDSATVSMSEQTDCVYDLHYPLPAAMPGTLKIHAAYLDRMVENHVATIYVMNAIGDRFGLGDLRPDSQDMEAHLPSADSLTTAHPAPVAVPAQPAVQMRQSAPLFLWIILAIGGITIVLAALRGINRKEVA